MPRIIGKNLMLREFQKEDLPHIREWVNDPDIANNLSDIFMYPHTLNETETFLNGILEGKFSDEKHFIIAEKVSGDYIGQMGLLKIDWKNRTAEVGIVIGKKDLLGKGIGTEAMRLLQQFAFERMNLNRLELTVHDFNARAIKCYEKSGFTLEGRLRQKYYFNGKYTDIIIMSILKEER
ncbi:Protein N-acetyltransferase, RimJ/RimL family [Anaerovirgula multivorans]|uniref:Protein N-acetyltransferase, RimJ/RimL family n=1 Tax=Anaerovirgula multivorans TaxID=312168 RepID=A0A239JBU9_9FIRM|nr:GNAT family protein [Anaerovirgula multivorans]SNT03092.1 Protein N-acetyltransferase, RimJ/RimL family [Anaerovirgula multivorans]